MNSINLFWAKMAGLSVLIIYMSCNIPSNQSLPEVVDSKSMKQISHISYGTDPEAEKWYEYLENGDLYRYNSFLDTIVFEYTNDRIVKRYSNKGNEWLTRIIYDSDTAGRVTASSVRVENDEELSRFKFEYNSNGFLQRTIQNVVSSGYTYRHEYKYTDGNLAEVMTYTYDGKPAARYLYEYYPGRKNILNIFTESVLDDYFTNNRLGRTNKNQIKQLINVSMEGDTLSWLQYKYEDDPAGNYLKQIEYDALNENITERIFHFKRQQQ